MALSEDAQTLFMVVAIVVSGRPAPIAHWRAGFWPRLGKKTLVSCCARGGGRESRIKEQSE